MTPPLRCSTASRHQWCWRIESRSPSPLSAVLSAESTGRLLLATGEPYPSICTFGNGRLLHPRIVPTPATRRRRIHTRRATSDGNAQRAGSTCRRLGEDRLPCHLGPERRRRSACRDYLVGAASGADPSTSCAQVWLRCDVAHAPFRQPALKLCLPVRDLDPSGIAGDHPWAARAVGSGDTTHDCGVGVGGCGHTPTRRPLP